MSARQPAFALAAAGVALAAAVVFLPVRHHEFIDFDDPGYVTDNAHVERGITGAGLAWALRTTAQANWHPLTWLSHMLDVELYGMRPGAHHLTSVALHALNAALLVLWLGGATGRVGRAAAVGLLFAVHPLRIESVAWVAERKDVLSSAFGLVALIAYTRWAVKPSRRGMALVACLFALSLASKPMWVTLPFVLLLVDLWPLARLAPGARAGEWAAWAAALWRLVREKWVLFAAAFVSAALTLRAQATGGAMVTAEAMPLPGRLANALVAWVAYLGKWLWPRDLAFFYPYPERIPAWKVVLALVLLSLLSAIVLRWRRRHPEALVGWLWYLGTLVPVIGLVQVGSQSFADRYTYLPLIGPLFAAVWLGAEALPRGPRSRLALAAITVLLATGLALATRRELRPWRTGRALFEHALAVTEANHVAHDFLGVIEAREGRLDAAMAHHREALRLASGLPQPHNNLGVLLAGTGRLAEAIEHYRRALALAPGFAEAHNNLGIALAEQGQLAEAERHFREALAIRPDNPEAHHNLGIVLASREAWPETLEHYLAALELRPEWDELAVETAWLLATLPDPGMRDGQRAVELARRAAPAARALDVLGAALAETGRFEEAVRAAERARDLALAGGRVEQARDIERRRQSYAAGRPWRSTPAGAAVGPGGPGLSPLLRSA